MPDPRPLPPSDEHGPRSGSPTVASAPPDSASSATKAPYWIAALGLLGVVAFVLLRMTMPPRDLAVDCLRAALADKGLDAKSLAHDAEIVAQGKLDVAGHGAADSAKGPLAHPIRRDAIERCRAVYAERMGGVASRSLLVQDGRVRVSVERKLERRGVEEPEAQFPVAGAEVSVDGIPGQGTCVTSASGYCDLPLRDVPHDVKLGVTAKLGNGAVVSRSTSVLALLQSGLRLEALERAPAIRLSVLSCEDGLPLPGVMVQLSAPDALLWSTDCGVERPEQPGTCDVTLGRHGEVSFHYDRRPERLVVTLIPPGEGERETHEVVLGGASEVELTYGACQAAAPPAVDCQATRRSVESAAQLTRVPAGAGGHQLNVLVEVMSSGIVADIQPAMGSDSKALSALRAELAKLRGLAGPCRDLPVTLRY